MNRPIRSRRRGVLILVVMGILILFLLTGVAFILGSGQFHTSAQFASAREVYGTDARLELDAALREALRDVSNTESYIRYHSILRDMYGNDGLTGTLASAQLIAGSQLVDCTIDASAGLKDTDGNALTGLEPTRGYYNGCVFTIVSGPSQGTSTYVVDYDGSATFRVLAWKARSGTAITSASLTGARFVVNGRPYNGTGAGYNPATGKCDALQSEAVPGIGGMNLEVALLPNRSTRNNERPFAFSGPDIADYNLGGLDEGYDAPDHNNMFLAWQGSNPHDFDLRVYPIPSFHRPRLFQYWRLRNSTYWASHGGNANYMGANANSSWGLRWISLRPLTGWHLWFGPRSFPELPPNQNTSWDDITRHVAGPWDVDNDGDRVRDSIWTDLGFPVQVSAEGQRYKPLFAFLILDLDGRLNVNAAGSLAQVNGYPAAGAITYPDGVASTNLPKGMGLGAPEIDLRRFHFTSAMNDAQYTTVLQSRYGGDGLPGQANVQDVLSRVRFFGHPADYFNSSAFPQSYFGSPIDLRGQLSAGVDHRGQPLHERYAAGNDLVDSPFEVNLSGESDRSGRGADAPFTLAELERLLRRFDRDGPALPNRLAALMPWILDGDSAASPVLLPRAGDFTTDSWDTPFPNVALPVTNGRRPQSILHLLQLRLEQGGVPAAEVNNQIALMLSPDLYQGLRMDINRKLGNGQDDNDNLVVDESGDPANPGGTGEMNEQISFPTPSGDVTTSFHYTGFDQANVLGAGLNNSLGARHMMARHLYVLMMLLKEPGRNIDFDGNPGNDSPAETARGLAQWAVNAVDFYDSDSIMTPFEYDINPFNGWDVDGDISPASPDNAHPERGLVWGCERPELLITETLAWHDRATEDRDDEAVDPGDAANPAATTNDDPADTDWDQRFRPRGAFFVELYNPWTGDGKFGPELYDFDGTTGTPMLRLNRTTPTGNSPVWRVLIVEGANDPNSNEQAVANYQTNSPYDPEAIDNADIERSIYFVNDLTQVAGISGHGTPYVADDSTPQSPIVPGRYAVVGTGRVQVGNQFITPVGRRTDAVEGTDLRLPTTRSVVFTPPADASLASAVANQVRVLNNSGANPGQPAVADIKPAVAYVINQPRPVSISEPTGGDADDPYYENTVDPGGAIPPSVWTPSSNPSNEEGKYVPPIDEPLDAVRAANDARWSALLTDGTTPRFRTVHLQRLANPLVPWNGTTNPYITIDTMSVDLTAFNGAESGTEPGTNGGTQHFRSLQRGDRETGNPKPRTFWRHEPPTNALAASSTGGGGHFYDRALNNTLGFLNLGYHPYFTAGSAPNAQYIGDPNTTGNNGQPFPWLTWNNRPYLSQMELMLVPKSSPGRLAMDFPPLPAVPNTTHQENYTGQTAPFAHLLNFFDASPQSANLARLFDFTHVPSRFAGTQQVLHPATFNVVSGATQGFRPPFNVIPAYREPGRMNINTAFAASPNGPSFLAAHNYYAVRGDHSGPHWTSLLDSRRSYPGSPTGDQLARDGNMPTFFANPFRPFGAGSLVPLSAAPSDMSKRDIDATLMRPLSSNQPLFTFGIDQAALIGKHNQINRHAAFRYQSLNRTANLFTSRSHVFAVWITVGYFHVADERGKLGGEIGADLEASERHRAFYIIDRSIPVAFEPGHDHNVDDCIRVRRFLE